MNKITLMRAGALVFVMVITGLALAVPGGAVCKPGPVLNPITDLCWHCIFPLKFGGLRIPGPPVNTYPDEASAPFCVCPSPIGVPRYGIPFSWWEASWINETVKDPYCFPSIGTMLSPTTGGLLAGGSREINDVEKDDTSSFAQAHNMIFLPFAILGLLEDLACKQSGQGLEVAYITELDPLWQNDLLAAFQHPEALLFANPVAQLACVPDAVSSNIGFSLSPLFWCAGSGGSVYPLTGHVNNDNYLQANETISARLIYLLARRFLICDPGLWSCMCIYSQIWAKHNYRQHVAKPVRDWMCHPFGRSTLVWGTAKNPPLVGDNFAWVLFRKRVCCLGIN